jgi:hypothetical protein
VEQGAEHPAGEFSPVDLVAVADKGPFPCEVDDGRSGMDLGTQVIGEERPEVKVVVPLAVDDPSSRCLQAKEAVEDGKVVGKVPCRVADEELEEVAQDDEEVRFPLLLGEKGQKRPVIRIFGLPEVGIC